MRVIVAVAGLIILGWQLNIYLAHGHWPDLPLLVLVPAKTHLAYWLQHPGTSLSVHKALSTLFALPIWFVLLAIASIDWVWPGDPAPTVDARTQRPAK